MNLFLDRFIAFVLRFVYMSDDQWKLLMLASCGFLLGSIGLWVLYGIYLVLSGKA